MNMKLRLALSAILLATSLPATAALYSIDGFIEKDLTGERLVFGDGGASPIAAFRSMAAANVFAASSSANSGTVVTSGFNADPFVYVYGTSAYTDSISFNGPVGSSARVRLTAIGQMANTGGGRSSIGLVVYDPDTSLIASNYFYLGSGARSYRFNQSFIMTANSTYRYQLSATGATIGSGSFYSYLDPVITFSNAVPEPALWVQMIAGFGLAGLVARRRRRLQVLAA